MQQFVVLAACKQKQHALKQNCVGQQITQRLYVVYTTVSLDLSLATFRQLRLFAFVNLPNASERTPLLFFLRILWHCTLSVSSSSNIGLVFPLPPYSFFLSYITHWCCALGGHAVTCRFEDIDLGGRIGCVRNRFGCAVLCNGSEKPAAIPHAGTS